jgi:hypothetical protein
MKRIVGLIDTHSRRFDQHPFFRFISDPSIDPKQRLGYAPCISHFVMTFADIYSLVFRQEPPHDRYQELVNAHTYEDGGHYKWYLADLARIDCDERLPFSEALKLVWGDHSVRLRLLSYEICHLALHASSLQKLVLVQCIESAGKVSLTHVARSARDFTARGGKPLLYFGSHHVETEEQHTLEGDQAHDLLGSIELDAPSYAALEPLVERTFALFDGFASDLHAFALNRSPTPRASAEQSPGR